MTYGFLRKLCRGAKSTASSEQTSVPDVCSSLGLALANSIARRVVGRFSISKPENHGSGDRSGKKM